MSWLRALAAVLASILTFLIGSWGVPQFGRPIPEVDRHANKHGILEARLGFTASRMRALEHSRDQLIRACMRAHGSHWQPEPDELLDQLTPRGLFGLPTPYAIDAFLGRYGYGVTQHVHVIAATYRRFVAQGRNSHATWAMGASMRRDASSLRRCRDWAANKTGGIDLASGGALGFAYGTALDKMRRDRQYHEFEASVLACMSGAGIELERLDTAAQPYMERLVHLVGGSYSRSPDGVLTYDVGTESAKPYRVQDLDRIRSDELRRARIERGCREQQGDSILQLWARYSAPVMTRYEPQIRALRKALSTKGL